jgi:hypothetical protein
MSRMFWSTGCIVAASLLTASNASAGSGYEYYAPYPNTYQYPPYRRAYDYAPYPRAYYYAAPTYAPENNGTLRRLLPTTHHRSQYGYLFDLVTVADTAFGTANTVPTRAINLPIWGLGGDGSMPSCSRAARRDRTVEPDPRCWLVDRASATAPAPGLHHIGHGRPDC